MATIIDIGKKILAAPIFDRLRYVIHYPQIVVNEFIIKEARQEIPAKSKILDVGAGGVRFKQYFSDCEYLTQDFGEYKDSEGKFQYGQIDYVGDATDIPVESGMFDVVICTDVIEHVQKPEMVLKEISRVLKPGGRVYLTSCLVSGVHQPPHHYYSGFTRFWYQKYLSDHDFKNISIRTQKGFFAFYSNETLRALMYFLNSKKIRHRIFQPLAVILIAILPPILFSLDKYNLDHSDVEHEFTMGYLVKAQKI
jgi:ubiquinone/menaquinone biosynthesis C-methylase UbiE